jgi:hypothetical protein
MRATGGVEGLTSSLNSLRITWATRCVAGLICVGVFIFFVFVYVYVLVYLFYLFIYLFYVFIHFLMFIF